MMPNMEPFWNSLPHGYGPRPGSSPGPRVSRFAMEAVDLDANHCSSSARLATDRVVSDNESGKSAQSSLRGKRAAMVMLSCYPADPRPRRAADALVKEGMSLDLVCLGHENAPKREAL